MARPFTPLANRLWDKFLIDDGDACWPWVASITTHGYGQINSPGRTGRPLAAYRVMYELARGPIPEGLYIDHLCRNRACVNPWHMEPVTHAENVRRGEAGRNRVEQAAQQTACKRGHEYTPENTGTAYNKGRPCRRCRKCMVIRQRRYVAARQGLGGGPH